jgi:flagellar M-ring protein FliF
MAAIDLDRIKEQGKRFVDGFTPGQKAMTILGVVAVVFGGVMFMKWAATPDWAPLYSGLTGEDAAAVTQQLDEQGVPYKMSAGGNTILVPKKDVYTARVNLSAEGIPSGGGDSYKLLDEQGITTDQFTRNTNYQRALQGELGRTIESIDGVQAATVTLTMPQSTVFVGAEEDKPTAAVLVKSGGEVGDSTVQAIVHLVASSIPNMNAADVTVADAAGKVLHAPGVEATGGSQTEQKQGYEASVATKITEMIERTLGPGHAAVTVNADLDMSKRDSKSVVHTNPAQGTNTLPINSTQKSVSLTEPAGSSGANGQLGVGGVDTGGTATNGAGTRQYTENETKQNNAVNSTTTNAVTPPGEVQRMSVSVLLDEAVVTPDAVTNTWLPQISAAAGIQPERDGAQAVQVTAIAFDQEAQKAAQAQLDAAASGNAMFDLIKHFLTLLMIGLVLFFAWRAIKRAESNRVPLRVPLDLRELEAAATAAAALPAGQLAAVGAPAAGPRSLQPPPPSLEGEITDLIERQPDEVAQTLRSWLADRRG